MQMSYGFADATEGCTQALLMDLPPRVRPPLAGFVPAVETPIAQFLDTSKEYFLRCDDNGGPTLKQRLQHILLDQNLSALFQPIASMQSGDIVGYEGLIRGPSDSPLHSPINLFRAAEQTGLLPEIESLCRRVVLESFARLQLPGKLFMNVSPEVLIQPNFKKGETLSLLDSLGLGPERVVIELTENRPTLDYEMLREATVHYRSMGFEIAMDDLGEGFSSLRLWSELRPDYVKIDMHFIQSINRDPVKLQFARSIQQIAENADCRVIAEGIETHAELMVIKDLGISYGQGYHLGRPSKTPSMTLPMEVGNALGSSLISVYPQAGQTKKHASTAAKLLREVEPVAPYAATERVYERFVRSPRLHAVPVVEDGVPVGLINRYSLIDRYARPFQRELYGNKPCSKFMDGNPLIIDKGISVEELSRLVVDAEHHYLSDGFIVTEHGRYVGLGTGHDLMRELTRLQITAARYANPLTLLPGNVPITEHIDRLLEARVRFCICYCDLNYFKPFNDGYGFRKGDEVIQLTGGLLVGASEPERDFVGHIGGDDFVILYQSPDWETRCQALLAQFEEAVAQFFDAEDRERGGFYTEDRTGNRVFHPLTSIAIGAVVVEPGAFDSHHEISAAAAEAKRQAKRVAGNNLFVERRRPHRVTKL